VPEDRRAQIAANLAAVRVRIAAACTAAGRPPDDVTLVAISKTYPAADVLHLAALGVADIGENRDQEAAPKAAEVAAAGARVRWHFVGRLQRNKARSVAGYADLVHSVDSVRLAQALGVAAVDRPAPLGVLVQVSIDGDSERGGAVVGGPPDVDLDRVADAVASAEGLRLRGVMAVAPLDWAPGEAFARLAGIAARLRDRYPDATVISAGMSGDLEAAVEHGATHVRIGAALLGNRAPLR
jgi:pyridoxal phosphate enzyme (YggS family)